MDLPEEGWAITDRFVVWTWLPPIVIKGVNEVLE
jgi:hypothetical protein